MKNPSINFNGLKDFFSNIGKNLIWLFFVIFLALLVFEIFEIKQSVGIVLNSDQQSAPVTLEQGVRINFDNYNQAVSRIENGQTFVPPPAATSSPFGTGSGQ